MADEFTLVGATPVRRLLEVHRLLRAALLRMHFQESAVLYRLVRNEVDHDFEVADPEDVGDGVTELRAGEYAAGTFSAVEEWDGWLHSYFHPDLQVGVFAGSSGNGFINVFVKILDSQIMQLFRDSRASRLYRVLSEVLYAVSCAVALMDLGLDLPILNEAEIVRGLLETPAHTGYPASVGLVSASWPGERALLDRLHPYFRVTSLPHDYWLLEDREYLDVYSRSGPGIV